MRRTAKAMAVDTASIVEEILKFAASANDQLIQIQSIEDDLMVNAEEDPGVKGDPDVRVLASLIRDLKQHYQEIFDRAISGLESFVGSKE